ncbi:caspase family protein [Micromonospora sp. HK10]|uniref:effector-associated domain 2-containing protein n=1 Tax=Micromonospora sp. HK10 TaxID=1538294 RepID=UPI0006986087|nr:caspase family protein [Micromonospora sp. HK10]
MGRDHDPREVHVVAVGIDQYAAGREWSLVGPADDALRFARWFVARDVPPGQVTVLSSPCPGPDAVPPGVVLRPADRATVREVLVRELPARQASTLYVIWGGHGYVDTGRRRRLYYADASATDPASLDLDSMLATFASDLVPTFDQQVWIIDACQLHDRPQGLAMPGSETFPVGTPVAGRRQDVLFAAGFGQAAANLGVRRTGLFSREVLRLLDDGEAGRLAQPERLMSTLRERFADMRASGLTAQTPTYLWHRNALGDEGLLLHRSETGTVVPAAPAPSAPSPARLGPLVDALLQVPEFLRPNEREEILTLLRGPVYAAIRRSSAARPDAISVVRTCLRYPGALSELVEAVRFFATDDAAMTRVEDAAARLVPHS